MNVIKSIKAVLLSTLFVFGVALADSPLTDTTFEEAYDDYELIVNVEPNSDLTLKQLQFLTSDKVPLGAKLALVGALGVDFDGKDNATIYLSYLQDRAEADLKDTTFQILEHGSADELIIYAYLKGMDDYFYVEDALYMAQAALGKKPNSLAINMINALLQAQVDLDDQGKWCKIYEDINQVRMNKDFETDLRREALNNIFEYIDFFKPYCK